MGRWNVPELEDQPWFPATIRGYMVDWLEFLANFDATSYAGFAAKLNIAMKTVGTTKIVDLCSGGAGPVRTILKAMRGDEEFDVTATLTDLYPSVTAFERAKSMTGGRIDYIPEPIDATAVPAKLDGFRLLSNSFHHFPRPLARKILADAAAKKRGIAVVEVVGRSIPAFLSLPVALVTCLIATPVMRPFRWGRILFTYLIPIVPLAVMFDGVMSCLRVYSLDEMKELTQGLGDDGSYVWEIGRVKMGRAPMMLTYLIGLPKLNQLNVDGAGRSVAPS